VPSSSGGKNLFGDLSQLNQAINIGDYDVRRVMPFLDAALNNEPDTNIWQKVYVRPAESIVTTEIIPSTPYLPPSDPSRTASFKQSPWTFDTGICADTSDLRNVDSLLRTGVEDNLRIDHPERFATFFGKIPKLSDMTAVILQRCSEAEPPVFPEDVGWVDGPAGCEEALALQFLCRRIDRFLLLAAEHGFRPSKLRRCVATPNKYIPGLVSKR
jgi:hypothetical protein